MSKLPKLALSATLLLAISQLLSRLLGVWRDHLLAQIFGATSGVGIWQLDTYYAAFRLPDLVFNLLIFGVLSAAFVPLLSEARDTQRFASNVLNVLVVSILLVLGIIFITAKPLIHLLTPGFDTAMIQQTVALLRIQLLAPLAFSFSAVFGGLAQHQHRFVGYALAPILYNLGIIAGAAFFGEQFGVYGLSWGVALGALAHALAQIGGASWGGGFRWVAIWQPRELRPLFELALPRVLAVMASQGQFVVLTIFASLIGAGALTVFNYSWNLASLPLGVVGLAFATASFARLSQAANKPAQFTALLRQNVWGVLFWVVPAAIGLFCLRSEIVRLILSGGAFASTDEFLVTESLAYLAWAVPAFSLLPLLANAFFARKNTTTPLVAGILGLLVTSGIAYATRDTLYSTGLAAAYAGASWLSLGWLSWRLPVNIKLNLQSELVRILISSAVLAGVVLTLSAAWPVATIWGVSLKLAVLSSVGAGIYLWLSRTWHFFPRAER